MRLARNVLLVLLAMVVLQDAPAQEKAVRPVRKDLKVEDLGAPLKRRRLHTTLVYKERKTGQLHLLCILVASNGLVGDPKAAAMGCDARVQLLDFNTATGVIHSALGPMCEGARPTWLHSNGFLYILTGRPFTLIEFDPQSGNLRPVGRLTENYFDTGFNLIETEKGVLYMGSWGGHVARYDPVSDKVDDLGLMGSTKTTYMTAIAEKDGFLYCMPWAHGTGGAVVYDLATRQQTHYFPSQSVRTGEAGTLFHGEDGNIYFSKANDHYRFDRGKPVKLDARPPAKPRKPAPRQCLDVWEPGEAQQVLGLELDFTGMDPHNWNNGAVTIRWRKKAATGAAEEAWQSLTYQGVALVPNSLGALAPTPEGTLLGVGSAYGPVFTFDPKTGKADFVGGSPGSIYDVLVSGNMACFCGYSSILIVYDRSKPWTMRHDVSEFDNFDRNPVRLGAAKWATHMALDAKGRVHCLGNQGGRHDTGAQWVVYDPASRKHVSLRRRVEQYGTRDIIAVNGRKQVVMSGTRMDQGKGALLVYDAEAGDITREVEAPFAASSWGNLFAAEGATFLGLIKADRRDAGGRTIHESIVYKYDLAAGKLLLEKKVPGKAFNGPSYYDYRSSDRHFCVGPDGCGWLFIDNDLARIHPDGTVEKVARMDLPARMLFLGDDLYMFNGGRQEFGGFSNILRVRDVFR